MQQEPTPLRKRHESTRENQPANRGQPFHDPTTHDLVVIGASAGGIEALLNLASHLPASLHRFTVRVLATPLSAGRPSLRPT
jgi:chemotaxis response regulator CheB